MGYKVHSIDGETGEVELDHLQYRSEQVVLPAPAAGVHVLHRVPVAGKVKAVYGYRVGGTGAVVKATKNGATDLLSANKSLTSADVFMAGALHATPANLAVAAGDVLAVEVVSVAGAPTSLTLQVDYEIDVPA